MNGAYKDTAALKGKFIHDIMTTDPQEMLVPEIQQPFTQLKNAENGQREMTYALEQLIDKGREEGRAEGCEEARAKGAWKATENVVRNMTAAGFPIAQIADLTSTSADLIRKIMHEMVGQPQQSWPGKLRRIGRKSWFPLYVDSISRSSHCCTATRNDYNNSGSVCRRHRTPNRHTPRFVRHGSVD